MKKTQANYTILVITVENKFGVLARVSGLFSRRGVNIKSLAVAPTDKAEFSRITVDLDIELESVSLDQIINQPDKLINVVCETLVYIRENIEHDQRCYLGVKLVGPNLRFPLGYFNRYIVYLGSFIGASNAYML